MPNLSVVFDAIPEHLSIAEVSDDELCRVARELEIWDGGDGYFPEYTVWDDNGIVKTGGG
jgi:hypothetical protein